MTKKVTKKAKSKARLYKATIELEMMLGFRGRLTKKNAREQILMAIRSYPSDCTGLSNCSLALERVTSKSDIPRTWRNAIPFGMNFDDASCEQIVEGEVDDLAVNEETRDQLIDRLLCNDSISEEEAAKLR